MYNGMDHVASPGNSQYFSNGSAHGHGCDSNSSEEQRDGQQVLYQPRRLVYTQHPHGGQFRVPVSMVNFEDSMTEIIMDDVPSENEPTSAILDYCKKKFLRPYMRILGIVGLNPIPTDTTECKACLSYLQTLIILLIISCGYFLEFLASFRGDRGFTKTELLPWKYTVFQLTVRTWGEILFGYVVPSGLHLFGFISAIIVCKVLDKEQLQNLIERVFLMSVKPRSLCRMLWLHVGIGFTLLLLLFGYVVPSVLMKDQIVRPDRLLAHLDKEQLAIKVPLLCTIFVQDLVEVIILTTYCIECYLLRLHLHTLSQKLLMHTIESLDWMKEVLEFHKLLDHLNNQISIPVCFLTVMNLSYAFAGLIFLFKDLDFQYTAIRVIILNFANVFLWLLIGLLPFFTAAAVTRACQTAQAIGHQIRVRPFLYNRTSADDLNSTLLFASSLNMSAKLFRMPIQSNYLCFAILVISLLILTLGMCLNFSLGIF